MIIRKIVSATLAIGLSAVFMADAAIISGERDGLSWQARSTIIGAAVGSTGNDVNLLGNSLYHPTYPEHGGVVALVMETPAGFFICSGTLMEDRRSILTAAHCVSDGAGKANPISTRVYFNPEGGLSPDVRLVPLISDPTVIATSQSTVLNVTDYFVNENYTGEVIDQNDIAVLRMDDFAPSWAPSYGVYTDSNLTGLEFNVAGYGGRSSNPNFGNGNTGRGNPPIPGVRGRTGYLRQGYNKYDYAFGNSAFEGFFTDIINGTTSFGTADIEFSYISDFDNGLAGNDSAGRVSRSLGLGDLGGIFNDVGLGEREVGIAGGDSGGPNFINGLISGVNSYGLTFGSNFGDIDGVFNAGFGEFSGYVPTYIHSDFIRSSLLSVSVSAPGVLVLMGLSLFAVGGSARARRKA